MRADAGSHIDLAQLKLFCCESSEQSSVKNVCVDTTAPMVFDISGRKIHSENFQNLPDGLYLIKQDKDVKKILIRH